MGIVLGILLGYFSPDIGASMKPLGDAFIKLVSILRKKEKFDAVLVHGADAQASKGDQPASA